MSSLRILTWNVNGLRAAIRKGLDTWLETIAPDVVLLQEIRARPDQLPPPWSEMDDWHVHWHPAERPGYSGTCIWSRRPISRIEVGIDGEADPEGRLVVARIDGIDLGSVYLPSGSSSDEAQVRKNSWMKRFAPYAQHLFRRRRAVILGGDFNIARTERDLFHWRSNRQTSGFLPHEREWMDDLVKSGGRDLVREHHGDVDGPYTWWSNRGKARELDRGWRIDYLLGNARAARGLTDISVHREAGLAISDHAPVILDLALESA
ncbi:MAG: exodeoxyribonuclease III [Phycisphaerales bacterium]|nr:exodeoxyribonuclease III [Phycisphaerales bacterium]